MDSAPTVHVQVAPRYARRVRASLVQRAVAASLRHQRVRAPVELTVRVTGDAEMRRLNRTHLGEDHTTDVLSFPGLAGTGPRPTSRRRGVPGDVPHDYLGDIVISHPRAQAQARDAGHSVTAELQLLIVHGVLHLLGHDHDTPRRKKVMWAAQENILRGLEGRPIQKSVQTARR